MSERGFTLIETLVAVAIVMLLSLIAWGFSSGDRALAAQSAATIFDAELAHARALAATSGEAVTLVFTPASPDPGVVLAFSPAPVDVPPETLRADVSEASLGQPPFAISVDPYGHATGPQPCPAAGGFTLTFSAGPGVQTRFLPCPAVAAGPPEPPGTVPP